MKYFINLFVILFYFAGLTCSAGEEISIITNLSVPKGNVTRDVIKNIYSGKLAKWPDNQNIVLSIMEGTETHKEFLYTYVNKPEAQFTNTWRKKMFTGQRSYPKNFNNAQDLVDFVRNTKGAIGYVNTDEKTNGVNVFK
ncbi:MAG: substrate-binding domain-containing protein [Proteobacteria bacterium]|nr:substrate-binding domain-containing protein [Pseudomonadota bacterium]